MTREYQGYWMQGDSILIRGRRFYKNEAAMRSAAVRLVQRRANSPLAELWVYAEGSEYSGPNEDTCVGKAAFAPDGETVKFFTVEKK